MKINVNMEMLSLLTLLIIGAVSISGCSNINNQQNNDIISDSNNDIISDSSAPIPYVWEMKEV